MKLKPPTLPKGRRWDALTKQWWADIWASPMAPEYLKADTGGLFRLALLVDAFWAGSMDVRLAAEIRQEQAAYGLSPLDRRRLEWTIEKTEQEKARRKKRAPRAVKGDDPRNILRPEFKSA